MHSVLSAYAPRAIGLCVQCYRPMRPVLSAYAFSAIGLCAQYAQPGTDGVYGATRAGSELRAASRPC
eukprot:691732-Rhodomonas_salina.1